MQYVVVVDPPHPAFGAGALMVLAGFVLYKFGAFGIVSDVFAWCLHIAFLLTVLMGALFGGWVLAMLLVRARVPHPRRYMVVGLLVAVGGWTVFAANDLTGGRVSNLVGKLYSAISLPHADARARPVPPQALQDGGVFGVTLRSGVERTGSANCGATRQPCAAPPQSRAVLKAGHRSAGARSDG